VKELLFLVLCKTLISIIKREKWKVPQEDSPERLSWTIPSSTTILLTDSPDPLNPKDVSDQLLD